jgi:hypothetical protein
VLALLLGATGDKLLVASRTASTIRNAAKTRSSVSCKLTVLSISSRMPNSAHVGCMVREQLLSGFPGAVTFRQDVAGGPLFSPPAGRVSCPRLLWHLAVHCSRHRRVNASSGWTLTTASGVVLGPVHRPSCAVGRWPEPGSCAFAGLTPKIRSGEQA